MKIHAILSFCLRSMTTGLMVLLCLSLKQSGQVASKTSQSEIKTVGCSRIVSQKSSVYLYLDPKWTDSETIRIFLKNNSNCKIEVITTGKQIITKPDGRPLQIASEIAEDDAHLVLRYKINSTEQPWAFVPYWPYGDSVASTQILPGRQIKFLVKTEHLINKRQIAVPFYYEWDSASRSSALEHLVFSPY